MVLYLQFWGVDDRPPCLSWLSEQTDSIQQGIRQIWRISLPVSQEPSNQFRLFEYEPKIAPLAFMRGADS